MLTVFRGDAWLRAVRGGSICLLLLFALSFILPPVPADHVGSGAADSLFLGQDLRGVEYLEEPIFPRDSLTGLDSWRLRRKNYVISFNTVRGLANWVAYELLPSELEKRVGRRAGFIDDRETQPFSLSHSDYRGSGYCRGHLAPAADMRFSAEAQDEASLMSNIAPQTEQLNNGAWNTLENRIRGWANRYGVIYVVTGPLYLNPVNDKIANRVQVPSHFFKALLVKSKGRWQGIGFVMPQFLFSKNIWDYVLSIDELERVAGLDFFPLLPDDQEVLMQRELEPKVWGMPKPSSD